MPLTREIISVATVADGNPATALALGLQAEQAGVGVESYELSFTSLLANAMHQRISEDPAAALAYTAETHERRTNSMARLYGRLSFLELAEHIRELGEPTQTNWTVVQEHTLLGASPKQLERAGIQQVRLATPDVSPKESGILAVKRHEQAKVSVWNRYAYERLTADGVACELTQPYFLKAFHPDDALFKENGRQVVVKSSGSGMPRAWSSALSQELSCMDTDWAIHLPKLQTKETHTTRVTNRTTRIRNFFSDIGAQTQLLIGYPTELVQVACELRSRGAALHMLTLPPRGNHEVENLMFAYRAGIVRGEIQFDPDQAPTRPDIELIPVKALQRVMEEKPTTQWSEDIFGTREFWESEAA